MKHFTHRAELRALRNWINTHTDGRRIVYALAKLQASKHTNQPLPHL